MLKRRIIPLELLSGDRLVKTHTFLRPRDVGDPVQSSRVYSDQDADEIVILQIERSERSMQFLIDAVRNIAEQCFVPLAAGGGIMSFGDAVDLFSAGADKVVLNSITYKNPAIISEIADHYGSQAVIAGVDVRYEGGCFSLYSNSGEKAEAVTLESHIESVLNYGAGELLIQSIDRDGTMSGYEIDLLRRIVEISSVPIIAAGGAGNFLHLKNAFDIGVDAVACGSLFNFGDNNPLRAKAFLKNYGILLKKI